VVAVFVVSPSSDVPVTAAELTEPVWSAVDRSRGLIAHATRAGHTLCGISTVHWRWVPPGQGTPRCGECAAVPAGHATSHDFTPFITYRQLDYWTKKGHLRSANGRCGTGYRRTWPAFEVHVARLMKRLLDAELTLRAAARTARAAAEREQLASVG
jgi:MerR HTH family regulatory protein